MEKQQIVIPIKRHAALVSYSKEHHTGLLLSWKIRAGKVKMVDESRIAAYIQHSFENELKMHFRDEEDYLCPFLPEDDALIRQLRDEHSEIRMLVEKIADQPDNAMLTSAFADILDAHIRFEERRLFKYLQETLSQEQLMKLEAMDRQASEGCDVYWKDQFWL